MSPALFGLAVWIDACRSWAWIGAGLTLPGVAGCATRLLDQWWRTRAVPTVTVRAIDVLPPFAMVLVFILGAGLFLSMINRVHGVAYTAPWFVAVLAVMWAFLALAPWWYFCMTARRRRYAVSSAIGSWWACVGLMAATFVHA